ncbi:MAG: HEPN domain-containing protein [Proteobacteria bacterium]|nr:MAG: HEPN domain-containing protein [Pseudomonadota bacterium]
MTNTRTESEKALHRAADALENAEYNLKGSYTLAAANRSYYACYYCMSALLYTKNVYAKTHQGTKSKFTEIFIKDLKAFPPELSEDLTTLFDYRQEADYDLDADISLDEARNILQKASEFYMKSKTYLQSL